jgi:hypothetical protein
MERKRWKVSYKDKYEDLTNVWVYADDKEDAKRQARREYWDIERIIDVVPL